MFTTQSPSGIGLRRIAMALSLIVAVIYFVIALGFTPADFRSPPVPVLVVAAVAYLVGGLLILRAERRLLQVGVLLNALVLLAFIVSVVTGNATVDALSLFGKVAQIALEIMLLWILRRSSVPQASF